MNVIAEITRINERELEMCVPYEGSWHQKYKESAWIYIGGLPYELTEGDIICVMSQFGEIEDMNLVRDTKTGKSKGFAFIKYENQKSTVLAVDNMNGSKILERMLRVDHVLKYKLPKELQDKEDLEEEIEQKQHGLPGHAYEGKELANEFNLHSGQNVFESNKPTKKSKKQKNKKQKKKKEKKLAKIEQKQIQLFEQIRQKRQLKLKEEIEQAQLETLPSTSGWRGRNEPMGVQASFTTGGINKSVNMPQKQKEKDEEDSREAYEERERKRRAAYGGINRIR
jgi:RNA-binding motif X-linked protein 2